MYVRRTNYFIYDLTDSKYVGSVKNGLKYRGGDADKFRIFYVLTENRDYRNSLINESLVDDSTLLFNLGNERRLINKTYSFNLKLKIYWCNLKECL